MQVPQTSTPLLTIQILVKIWIRLCICDRPIVWETQTSTYHHYALFPIHNPSLTSPRPEAQYQIPIIKEIIKECSMFENLAVGYFFRQNSYSSPNCLRDPSFFVFQLAWLTLFLIAVVGLMGLNVDDSLGCGGQPRVQRDEEMDERRKTSREDWWVVRGAEICKQI